MRFVLLLAAAVASAQTSVPVDRALAEIAATHRFLQTAISPDGAHVAHVEVLAPGQAGVYIAPRTRVTAGDGKTGCDEEAIAWSPDGKQLAFLSDHEKKEQFQLYVAPDRKSFPFQPDVEIVGQLQNWRDRPTFSNSPFGSEAARPTEATTACSVRIARQSQVD